MSPSPPQNKPANTVAASQSPPTSPLPIEEIRESFEQAGERGVPRVVVAPTGSGKSTRIPLWLQESCAGGVLVVEPRRVACRALASFLAQEQGETVGQSVGYRVRFDAASGPQTQLEFVTPGVALRLLRDEGTRYEAVMLDEFHERRWEIDLLAALLRGGFLGQQEQQLVLTSATLEGQQLAESLGGILLESKGRTYPVHIEYTGGASGPTIRGLEERVVAAVQKLLSEEEKKDRTSSEKPPSSASAERRRDILVFLPGKGEIDACSRALSSQIRRDDLEWVEVHAGLPLGQLVRALAPGGKKRRVYLATNVAETSLTLPGVCAVVDAGLARMRLHRSGRSALVLGAISEPLMTQRAGRAGRLAPGRCLRLWDQSHRPEPHLRPEIEAIELDDLLLQAACYGLEGEEFSQAPWITPPPAFAIDEARQRLQRIHALDAQGHLTSFGGELARWPVSAYEATFLAGAPDELATTLADLVALLQLRHSLLLPLETAGTRQAQLAEERRLLLLEEENEVYVELRCLRNGKAAPHGLHTSALKQARAIARQLRSRLGLSCLDPQRDQSPFPSPDTLALWLLGRVPSLGFVLRPRARRPQNPPGRKRRRKQNTAQPWANGDIELLLEPFQPIDPSPSWSPPVAGVILAHTWISDRGLRVRGKGRLLLPCSLQTLAQAGLGKTVLQQPRLEQGKDTPCVVASLSQKLADVTLSSEESILQGEALCQAAATLILEDQLLPGASKALLNDLHLALLLHSWPDPQRTWPTWPQAQRWWEDPASYLAQRLQLLGLEECHDLALLEEQDLRPDLPQLFQLQPFELEALREEFPRQWSYQGALYDCQILPRQRKVILEANQKPAHKAPPPPPAFLPRFRGFAIHLQQPGRCTILRQR